MPTTVEFVGATGRPKKISRPDGLQTVFGYTPVSDGSRLQAMVTTNGAGSIIEGFWYGYDNRNLITTQTNFADGVTTVWNYDYDLAQQLIAATKATNGVVVARYAYGYDQAGNRVSEQVNTSASTEQVNSLNQILKQTGGGTIRIAGYISETGTVSVAGIPARMITATNFVADYAAGTNLNRFTVTATDVSGNSVTNAYQLTVSANGLPTWFSYDKAGNQLVKSNASQVLTFGWDGADRCTAITNGNQRTALAYDGLNRWSRITEYSNSTATADRRFVYNGTGLAEERDSTCNTVIKRYYPNGFWQQGTNYYYQKDHLGSVTAVTLGDGTVVARFQYDPYGRRTQTHGTLWVDFGYAGLFELPNGLKLAVWRVYDPSTARWLSKDPIREDGGWNLYAYCEGNPANLSDADGNAPQVNAFAKGSALYDRANKLTPKPGYFLVTGHGISGSKGIHARKISPARAVGDRQEKVYSPKELAALIAPNLQDSDHTIVLLTCNAAKPAGSAPSFAEQFLNEIRQLLPGRAIKVAAPMGPVNYALDFILPSSGAVGVHGVYVAGPNGELDNSTPGGNPLKLFQ